MFLHIKPENGYILHGFVKFQELHPQFARVLLNYCQAVVAFIIQSRNLFANNTYGDFFNRYYVHTDIVGRSTVSEALQKSFSLRTMRKLFVWNFIETKIRRI
ncbi:MAG: hypothetical protein EZS28_052685 [Streblomastix strix]|uniref:Uncharacterized protein n=1 Tax=Streblomastix strix TaxID=222440 RepID=A0A5J4RZC9_9EUKA|nr:MAG: hypothetical protein EZS28_052685 [Streblomastix strix]